MEKFEFKGTKGEWDKPKLSLDKESYYIGWGQNWDIATINIEHSPDNKEAFYNAHLIAASSLLLSALINIFDFPIVYMNKWRKDNDYINISITKEKLDNALCAIEAALNINPENVEK